MLPRTLILKGFRFQVSGVSVQHCCRRKKQPVWSEKRN